MLLAAEASKFPPGRWTLDAPLDLPKNITLWGHGPLVSIIAASHAGNGVQCRSPLNSTTVANTVLKNFGILGLHPDSTGAAFSDLGGTFVWADGIRTGGFARGLELDQTEIAHFSNCNFDAASQVNIWLVNGTPDGAKGEPGFTNRITISNCQINIRPNAIGLVDDGGRAHSIRECNFDGGLNHIVAVCTLPISIRDCEMEGASGDTIVFSHRKHFSGIGMAQANAVLTSNSIIPTEGRSCVRCETIGGLTMIGNILGNSKAPKVSGMPKVSSYFGRNNANAGGPMFDGKAARMDSDV